MFDLRLTTSNQTKMKKISGIYTQNYIIYNFYCQAFILLIIFAFIKSQSLDNNILLFSFIVKIFIDIFIFIVAKKIDIIKYRLNKFVY